MTEEITETLAHAEFVQQQDEIKIEELEGQIEIQQLRINELFEANSSEVTYRREHAELLRECCHTFREYQILHLAKGTPEGNEKAERNRIMANKIEALLHRPRNAKPVEIVKVTTLDMSQS